ncbi:hypothetical protein Clacol_002446 [Clathrus columnatus]|uniref:C2H2-type domain-containing protein n=1 Tax=Clathrus columnatus TaxID=1419009 RepID=A0AAV5A0T9_9AGAM|nr:hypothetical protein Clacol_002446 [Clathrus columnatus]
MPHVGNASNASQNNSQLYGGYQSPNDLSYNGSGGNVNSRHITNNTSWGSTQNWSNGQSQNHAGHGFGSPQQLAYPSDYISTNQVPSSINSQQFSGLDAVPPVSFTDPYQYPVQTQSNVNDLPASFYQNLNGTQSLFGYNGPPLGTNNESNSALRPLHNHAALLYDYSDNPHRVVGTDEAVAIGPKMQTTHLDETNYNMASALSAGAPFSSFSNASYPTTTTSPEFFLGLKKPSEQAFPSEFSTGLSNTFYHPNDLLSHSSSSAPCSFSSFTTSASETTDTTTFEEDPDNVPGLYQKISNGMWKCAFRECTKTTYHRRDRTRHVGKHANWEDRQIKAGLLRPEDAIAIPWRRLMFYQCDIPNCGWRGESEEEEGKNEELEEL